MRHNLKVKLFGYKRYSGNPAYICNSILKDCWNGQYLQTSTGHYSQFWTRDFGWCADSLMKLGYKDEVLMTLLYALSVFSENKAVTTAITPLGKPFNFPDRYAPDSLASLMHALHSAGATQLIREHEDFLNSEIKRFFNTVIEKDTGLVRRKTHFSSMRDHYVRDSSCYDNIMVAWLSDTLKKIKFLDNPFKYYDFRRLIKDNFWTGHYFLNDLSGSLHIAGDANVFPFWTKVFDSKKMMSSAVFEMQSAALDRPFPLKYTSGEAKESKIWTESFVPDWEKDSLWIHMGLLYLKIVKKVDRQMFREYYEQYKRLITKHKNFLEVYSKDGKPYSSLLYSADEGMLWCANFLTL